MSSFDAQIEKSKQEVAEAQSKIAELSSRIDSARAKMSQGTDITLDIENASLDDVHAHSDLMNANIACLLYTSPSPRDGLLSRMPSSA